MLFEKELHPAIESPSLINRAIRTEGRPATTSDITASTIQETQPPPTPERIGSRTFKKTVDALSRVDQIHLIDYDNGLNVDLLQNDPNYLKKLVAAGLEVVYICWHGGGRSMRESITASGFFDTPAGYLPGGMEQLAKLRLSESQLNAYRNTLSNLAAVPHVVLICEDSELNLDEYRASQEIEVQVKQNDHAFYRVSSPNPTESMRAYQKKLAPRLKVRI